MASIVTPGPNVWTDQQGRKWVTLHSGSTDGTLWTTGYLTKAEAKDLAKRLYDAACCIKDEEAGS